MKKRLLLVSIAALFLSTATLASIFSFTSNHKTNSTFVNQNSQNLRAKKTNNIATSNTPKTYSINNYCFSINGSIITKLSTSGIFIKELDISLTQESTQNEIILGSTVDTKNGIMYVVTNSYIWSIDLSKLTILTKIVNNNNYDHLAINALNNVYGFKINQTFDKQITIYNKISLEVITTLVPSLSSQVLNSSQSLIALYPITIGMNLMLTSWNANLKDNTITNIQFLIIDDNFNSSYPLEVIKTLNNFSSTNVLECNIDFYYQNNEITLVLPSAIINIKTENNFKNISIKIWKAPNLKIINDSLLINNKLFFDYKYDSAITNKIWLLTNAGVASDFATLDTSSIFNGININDYNFVKILSDTNKTVDAFSLINANEINKTLGVAGFSTGLFFDKFINNWLPKISIIETAVDTKLPAEISARDF